jgi:MFS family permease
MFNVVVWKSDVPDRYPMSPLIAMVVDVVIFFILFVPALVFPQFIWLAIAPMFLAIGELIVHGVVVGIFLQWRRDGRSIYNPGLATASVLGGIAGIFIYVVSSNGLAAWTDWVWGFLYFVSAMLVGLVLPEQGMKSKTTPWGFEHQHFLGYYSRYTTLEEVLGRRAST